MTPGRTRTIAARTPRGIRERPRYRASRFGSLFAALLLLPAPGAGADGIYTWKDEHGRIHYGDKPPPGASRVEIENSPGPDPELEEQRRRERRLLDMFREQQQEREEDARAARAAQQEADRKCEEARGRLHEYEIAQYIFEPTDDPLNPRILTEAERQQATQQVRAEIRRWCRAPGR